MPDRLGASGGRLVLCLVFAVVFLGIAWLYVSQSVAVGTIRLFGPRYLFAAAALPGMSAAPLAPSAVRRGLEARPLSQVQVNAALFTEVTGRDANAEPSAQDFRLLRKLGWRYTPALQNLMLAAAQRGDLQDAAELADALLRRDSITEQATTLMNLIEAGPGLGGVVVEKLAKRPRWRLHYLQTVDQLRTAEQVAARGSLALNLQRRGSALSRDELTNIALRMVDVGQVGPAYLLWRNYRGAAPAPLNDPDFSWALRTRTSEVIAMPFEWMLLSGSGFWSEIEARSKGAAVRLHWDNRGVPEMLTQQLFLRPGRYVLTISGDDLPATLLQDFAFSLRCRNGATTRFDRQISRSGARIAAAASQSVPCADPVFIVSGRTREGRLSPERQAFGNETTTLILTGLRLQLAGG